MTHHVFDAPASPTRSATPSPKSAARTPALRAADRTRRYTIRIAWLVARFTRRETVSLTVYEERFDRSERSFRRDIAALRDAGLSVDSNRTGAYRMLCFNPDREAA